jgi:endonuclease I
MRNLLRAALIAWLVAPAHGAEVARPVVIEAAPRIVALPTTIAVPALGLSAIPSAPIGAFAPSLALPAGALLPQGADARLDPAMQATMSNPVPATALGLKPGYFAPAGGAAFAAQATLPTDGAVRPGALEASRRVADASKPDAAPGASASISNSVFDGLRQGPAATAVSVSARAPARGVSAPSAKTSSRDETAGLSGSALLQKLHEISGRGYHANDYDTAHKYLFKTADHVMVGGKTGIVDAYSGIFEPGTSENGGDYAEHGDQNHDGYEDKQGMNVEHVWPQSFFDKRLPMRSDLHHLMATFIHPNGVRGNLPFGEVRGRGDYSNDAGAKRGQGVFEPPDAAKGRVARALLYFYTRYYDRNISNGAFGDSFWNSKLEMILRWNKQFPPTAWERSRNDLVEKFQGNRNPFVDDPSLADRIGLDGLRRTAAVPHLERARIVKRLGH